MELVEIIRGGQDAMDRGDYQLAAAACAHVLDSFPSCLTAHRMLGEAHLEQGQTDSAIEHFNSAITIDPLSVVARLGLGVAAEENRAMADAYSAYLHAWEINPALDQVRDELVRLRGLLGGGERLHPTRAGLAGIFIRGGQFGRAAAEWRAVIVAEPDNERARTSLAEILWRSGDDAGATTACHDVLRSNPENVRALAILADIEARRGNTISAELIERYQFVDPAGEILALLSEWRDDLDLSFLRRESVAMAEFDFSATPLSERVSVAAAPAPTNNAPGLGAGQFAAPDLWDTLVRDFKPGQEPGVNEIPLDDDVSPFTWQEEAAPVPSQGADPFAHDEPNGTHGPESIDLAVSLATVAVAAPPADTSFETEFAAMSSGKTSVAPTAASADRTSDHQRVVAHSAPAPTAVAEKPAREQFVTADGRVDLTVGWDDLDRQLRDATPNFDNAADMDELAAQLGVEGIQPFEVGDSPFDESAWVPFTDDDLGAPTNVAVDPPQHKPEPPIHTGADAPVAPVAPPANQIQARPEVEPIVEPHTSESEPPKSGWDMDNELMSSIPLQQASGYTEILRHVGAELPQDIVPGDDVDPFANPDAAGTPLEFEDIVAVTSRDGTSELTEPVEAVDQVKSEAELWAEEVAAVQHMAETGWPVEAIPGLSVDQHASDLEKILGEQFSAAEQDPFSGSEAVQPVVDDPLDEMFAALGDVQPFSLDDTVLSSGPASMDDSVDFSDINEAPFDPSTLPSVEPVAMSVSATNAQEREPIDHVAAGSTESSSMWAEVEAQVGPPVEEPIEAEPLTATQDVVPDTAPNEPSSRSSETTWPSFVSHTSQLIDRGTDRGNLFARLRDGKSTATATGLTTVERSLADLRPAIQQNQETVVSVQPGSGETTKSPSSGLQSRARTGTLTEEERLDLMALRIRLIEDESSAGEVALALETAIGRGLNDPLALRVLGEAYLKQGRTDQAASQFRNAMLARQRAR